MRDLYSLNHGAEGHVLGTPPGAWACVCLWLSPVQPYLPPEPHILLLAVSRSARVGGERVQGYRQGPLLLLCPVTGSVLGDRLHIQSCSKWRPVRGTRGLNCSLPFGLWPPSQLSWALILAAGLAPDGGAVVCRGEGEHQGAGMQGEQQRKLFLVPTLALP